LTRALALFVFAARTAVVVWFAVITPST
jgi:hypothetical protein